MDCAATVLDSKAAGSMPIVAWYWRLQVRTQSKHNSKGDVMLIKAKELKGYSLKSLDGDIGSASEFLFDDRYWAIRYLVANTATWLSGRRY
jgi:hypothetical protein